MSTAAVATTHAPAVGSPPAPGPIAAALAEFETTDALLDAARKMRDAGFTKWDTHTPYPVHGIDAAMGIKPTSLPLLIFACGLTGAAIGAGLQLLANGVWYPLVISGKPLYSLPANIPIIFELTILLSALGAVFGLLIFCGLPQLYNALFHSPRFARVTTDRFFVSVQASDPKFDEAKTTAFLRSLGSIAVETVRDVGTPNLPRWFLIVGVVMATIATVPLALIWRAWVGKSPEPRIHIMQDMDNQERFKAQQSNPLFDDGRAMRHPVEHTVARDELHDDPHYYTGMAGGSFAKAFPAQVKVDEALIHRGHDRYAIYCLPCHGADGAGRGAIAVRAEELVEPSWVAPLNLASEQVRLRAVGHLFNTITNGIRNMPPYDQVPVRDRWAIVAYVRTLQQHRLLDDVPAAERPKPTETKP